ncbi:Protein of unknown function [Mariniphaga anaerophila]|uniref:DUF2851 domain-containing protein n=1 Tax=Mariniphaga anaerophila TaxID=1484053 RepID=A0A1M5DFT2_9BACT|nr:DUF2851 family protein [Mariniphaga anaerophila]SHF65830.1 Protein of unknown function [Mariniphaga anaerophila]
MNTPKAVPEEFLHFIWENHLFFAGNLLTVDGEVLEIVSTGRRNTNAGPDFFNAKIRIGETIWAGNVEIHKNASDWQRHNHADDKSYENVILHVVENADRQVVRSDGSSVATLEMKWPEQFTNNYQKLLDAQSWVACQDQFHRVDPVILQLGFNRLMIERLEDKTGEIVWRLEQNHQNWNETFYQMLARMFGFKVNATPFELLAKAVPANILGKHKNSIFQLEALLFGASGLLNDELLGDDYFVKLRNEFGFLYKKYDLKPVEAHLWKFMRLRPGNFPTVRISQLAALVHESHGLFSKILETENIDQLKTLFRVQASSYWNTHFRFNKPSSRAHSTSLGESSINTIIINVVVPFLFVYGEKQNQHHLKNRALDFLEKLPPENNSIVKRWGELGIVARSAFESQALLQLKNVHCNNKKCLTCPIGNKLVKSLD